MSISANQKRRGLQMPAQYERIRDSYLRAGKPKKEAKRLAAMTYNAHRPKGAKPVGPHSDKKGLVQRAMK
jgi:hypothetical protein